MTKWCKFIDPRKSRHGVQFKLNVPTPKEKLEPIGEPGGFHYVKEKDAMAFIDYSEGPKGFLAYLEPVGDVISEKRTTAEITIYKSESVKPIKIVPILEAISKLDYTIRENHALRWASEMGHLEIVKVLLDCGADIHVHRDYPVRMAAAHGHLSTVQYLVEKGADAKACCDNALWWAETKCVDYDQFKYLAIYKPMIKYLKAIQ